MSPIRGRCLCGGIAFEIDGPLTAPNEIAIARNAAGITDDLPQYPEYPPPG